MNYTNEEIKIIKNNIKKIEDYCKTEILPQITGEIAVELSEIQCRTNGSSFRKSYGFYIDYNGTPIFRSSALYMVLDENYGDESFSRVNAYTDWRYTIQLLERWQTIKGKLNEEISKQRATKSSILNFQI